MLACMEQGCYSHHLIVNHRECKEMLRSKNSFAGMS